ncbi:CDP-glycerol glycerophosphotransferase family protein [Brachyspira pilosicoli]|uniref:CDP-glycerol--glycerophosphate glycerophosphotransferase n=1 Tax=Brachyspira pilosicoli TaxID=52584 RepID=A0A5C8ECW8_BRAPL|nr:CDP-glycerol glycerophosphotransferase family protein [Brachyspira pilosicoli]TXJ35626.1 CDP-glycerol--glycerophosphate glycerophosphotransferase [Brachyspira pilosicoli]
MIITILTLFILIQNNVFGYIDPGTGSLLFSALFGIIGTLFFLSKALVIKLKTMSFSKSKNIETEASKKARIIIYGEDKRYYNVFKPIIEELIKLEIPVIYYSSSEDDQIFEMKNDLLHTEFIGVGNKAYAKLNFIEADICLMTTPNLDVFQLKRSKGVKKYIHITHSSAETSTYCLYSLDFFDIVFLNGEHQIRDIRELERKRNAIIKDLYVVGSPYLDELSKLKSTVVKELKGKYKDNRKTVLLAPSWGMNCIFRRFGEKLIDNIVNSDYNVIIRPHPQSIISDKDILDKFKERYKDKDNVEWDFNRLNIYSLSRADIMISDFSGVIFDYLFLFEKPVIIPSFVFDKRGTDAIEIDEEVWTFETLPKISFKLDESNFSNISSIISQTINNNALRDNIIKAKEEAYMYPGESAKRSADYIKNMLADLSI